MTHIARFVPIYYNSVAHFRSNWVPAATVVIPILSSPGVITITSTSAYPIVTLTFN